MANLGRDRVYGVRPTSQEHGLRAFVCLSVPRLPSPKNVGHSLTKDIAFFWCLLLNPDVPQGILRMCLVSVRSAVHLPRCGRASSDTDNLLLVMEITQGPDVLWYTGPSCPRDV